jgi:hypothetical protein
MNDELFLAEFRRIQRNSIRDPEYENIVDALLLVARVLWNTLKPVNVLDDDKTSASG